MMRLVFFALAVLVLGGWANAGCPPAGIDREALVALKAAKWAVPSAPDRQALALSLMDCLADPDPLLRDDIAFEALSSWMRGGQLGVPTVQAIRTAMLSRLRDAGSDPQGYARPFAALTLAEVARVDRRQPFLSSAERIDLVAAGTDYLSGAQDYRGFDPQGGWRHGVAHAADLMLQLSLNPALQRAQHDAMLAAIAAQVAPPSHFYQYGEGERLMAPVFYLGRLESFSAADWDRWFAHLLEPVQAKGPVTQQQLARRHNLSAFLLPFYFALQESADTGQRQRMLPAVTRSLKLLD